MTGRIPARAARLLVAALLVGAFATLTAGAASAAMPIYSNAAKPKPKNLASIGFEATSTSEFGSLVEFGGIARMSPKVTVRMSSWACQNLLGGVNCASAQGSTFNWPITINIYELGPGNEPGALLATQTQ